jgi:AcrR family transcriptional regulator
LEAADNLLAEIGFAAVTIEGIAARAGVGKQTIYRWWPSKTDVLMDAFLDDAVQHLIPQDSGDLDRDLRTHLRNLAEFLTQSDAGAVFRALAGQAQHDAKMAERFRREYLGQQRQVDRVPLQRAIERGDLRADTDIELAVVTRMADHDTVQVHALLAEDFLLFQPAAGTGMRMRGDRHTRLLVGLRYRTQDSLHTGSHSGLVGSTLQNACLNTCTGNALANVADEHFRHQLGAVQHGSRLHGNRNRKELRVPRLRR